MSQSDLHAIKTLLMVPVATAVSALILGVALSGTKHGDPAAKVLPLALVGAGVAGVALGGLAKADKKIDEKVFSGVKTVPFQR